MSNYPPYCIELILPSPFYEMIRDGEKTYECRNYSTKINTLRKGDVIFFTNSLHNSEPIYKKVVKVRRYDKFKDLLTFLSLQNISYKGTIPEISKNGVLVVDFE